MTPRWRARPCVRWDGMHKTGWKNGSVLTGIWGYNVVPAEKAKNEGQ